MDTTASEMGVRSTGSGRPRKAAVMMGLGGGVGGQPDAIRVDPRLGARGRHPDVGALAGLGRRPLPHRSRRRFAPGRADAGDPPGAAVVGDRGEPRRHGDAVGRARHLALLNDLGRRLGGTLDLGTLAREMLLATEKLIPGAQRGVPRSGGGGADAHPFGAEVLPGWPLPPRRRASASTWPFSPAEIERLEAFATHASIALESARLHAEAQPGRIRRPLDGIIGMTELTPSSGST